VTAPARPWRWVAAHVGGLLACVVPYLVGVLLPYRVNGLHRLPLDELASGRHDPKLLWPSPTGCGGLVDLLGVLGLVTAPMGLVGGAVAGVLVLGRAVLSGRSRLRRAPGMVLATVAVAAACAAGLGWFVGETSAALVTWRMD
jgi:hypothetical protein